MGEDRDGNRPVEGVLRMAATALSCVVVNGIVKHLGTELPAAQSAFIRFASGLVILAPALRAAQGMRFAASTWRFFGWRGVFHVVAVIFWFRAVVQVPVAEIAAISFLNPVIMLVLAALLLGKGLSRGRVLGAAGADGGGGSDADRDLGLAADGRGAAGLAGGGGHDESLHDDAAFRATPLAVTQPVVFLQILVTSLLGALAFGEPAEGSVILGGALIVAAVSLNTWTETRREMALPQSEA